jgi:hypothetical protein
MTVISKCGQTPSQSDFPDHEDVTLGNSKYSVTREGQVVQILELPNVGRCDHSYAYWMQHLLQHYRGEKDGLSDPPGLTPAINFTNYNFDFDNDLVLFTKDNDNSYRGTWEEEIPFPLMMSQLLQPHVGSFNAEGFACRSKLLTQNNEPFEPSLELVSNMAESVELGQYEMVYYSGARDEDSNNYEFLSKQRPMWKWLEYLNTDTLMDPHSSLSSSGAPAIDFSMSPNTIENQNQVIPVCFGGTFMVTIDRITHNDYVNDWTPFVQSLSRGDNIEEGHYMERLWGALLSKPLPVEIQQDWIRRRVRHFTRATCLSFTGLLTVTIDGKSLSLGKSDDEETANYCFSCRLHAAAVDGKSTKADSMTSSILDTCYRVMELRGCYHLDEHERNWRIKREHKLYRALYNVTSHNISGKAELKTNIRDLYELWYEYEEGLDGHKPARLFTEAERSDLWYRRNAIWEILDSYVKAGDTVKEACNKIYMVYNHATSVEVITRLVESHNQSQLVLF